MYSVTWGGVGIGVLVDQRFGLEFGQVSGEGTASSYVSTGFMADSLWNG